MNIRLSSLKVPVRTAFLLMSRPRVYRQYKEGQLTSWCGLPHLDLARGPFEENCIPSSRGSAAFLAQHDSVPGIESTGPTASASDYTSMHAAITWLYDHRCQTANTWTKTSRLVLPTPISGYSCARRGCLQRTRTIALSRFADATFRCLSSEDLCKSFSTGCWERLGR